MPPQLDSRTDRAGSPASAASPPPLQAPRSSMYFVLLTMFVVSFSAGR